MRRAKGVVMSHRKARSIHAVVIAAASLVVYAGGVAFAQCLGDCNGDLAVVTQ
jgi:hypothetical protein